MAQVPKTARVSWARTSTTCFFPARAFISQPTCHHRKSSSVHAAVRAWNYHLVLVQFPRCC